MTIILDAPCGKLRGIRDCGIGVSAFLGIPYAVPPVGILRWCPPRPLGRWSELRDAVRAAARCVQHAPYGELEPDNPNMSEDCLYLNVWTPDVSRHAMLPVIFWIHGGEFWAGSGTEPRYCGASLAARGAVVVTFNHRLGVFGFLSHPELSSRSERGTSGNYGLLDQIAALNWVRENIAAFGGNPYCITVAGESAGSCSVSALMVSPLARGLFHRALGQSCAYFMPEAHAMKPLSHGENEQRGVEFARTAGADSLIELRSMPAQLLLEAWLKDTKKRFQPCYDGHVLPHVEQSFEAGQQTIVPLLAGWNREELGYLRAARDKFNPDQFHQGIERSFGTDSNPLLAAYESEKALETAVALNSDRTMVYPTWKWIDLHMPHAPVFAYQFDRAPPGSAFGATHACEIEYVFNTLDSKPRAYQPEDRVLATHIGNYWVNFARTGDPNVMDQPDWPIYGSEKSVLYLDTSIAAGPPHNRSRLELLDSIYQKRAASRGA
jgi:para-nitrobenzyl esterase